MKSEAYKHCVSLLTDALTGYCTEHEGTQLVASHDSETSFYSKQILICDVQPDTVFAQSTTELN